MATESDLKLIDEIIKKYYTITNNDRDREYKDDICSLIAHFNKGISNKIDHATRFNFLTPFLLKKHEVKFEKDKYKLNETKSNKQIKRGVYTGIKRNNEPAPEPETASVTNPEPVIVINPIIPEKFKSIDEIIKKYYIFTQNDEDREYKDDIIILIGHINKPLSDKIKNTHKSDDLTQYLKSV